MKIIHGAKLLPKIRERLAKLIMRNNELARGEKLYLKPVHIVIVKKGSTVKKYVYISRYWWRIKYKGKKNKVSQIKWKYLGKNISQANFNIKFKVENNDIIIDEENLEKLKELLNSELKKYIIVKED